MNLVSTQRIAKTDEYRIIFDDLEVILYNKVHEWKIGYAKVHDGLYYLHDTHEGTIMEVENKVTIVSTNSVEEKIHRLHKRLGHPYFATMKNMYLDLFGRISLKTFLCKASQLLN